MLNKPIVLSAIISLVFFGSLIAASIFKSSLYQLILLFVILFSFCFYMGKSHAKNFKKAMSKTDKIKISLYYFLFWFLSISSVVILMVMNTTVKNAPLFSTNPKHIIILLSILLMNFIMFGANSLCIYYALGLGCKLELSKIASNNQQESEPPTQA